MKKDLYKPFNVNYWEFMLKYWLDGFGLNVEFDRTSHGNVTKLTKLFQPMGTYPIGLPKPNPLLYLTPIQSQLQVQYLDDNSTPQHISDTKQVVADQIPSVYAKLGLIVYEKQRKTK